MNEPIRIPFCVEELDELHGKTIIATFTENNPRLLLLFRDRTAAIIEEDCRRSWGMMLADPNDYDREQALKMWNEHEQSRGK